MAEARVPQSWYALVSSDPRSLNSYLEHYRSMEDPSLEPMPSEGPDCAKLSSSTFAGFSDYEQVSSEARELAEIMTGAIKVRHGLLAHLDLKNIVGVHSNGDVEKFPTSGRAVSFRIEVGRPIFKDPGREIWITQSITRFALQCNNPYVREVLRELARANDWGSFYRIMETIILDLNSDDPRHKKDGRDKIVRQGWALDPELTSFFTTADSYRHRRGQQSARTMQLYEARNLVSRIVESWLGEVARRPAT
jgi:hypothetical protein